MLKRVACLCVVAGIVAAGGARAADLDDVEPGPAPTYHGHPVGPVVFDERAPGPEALPPGSGWPDPDGGPRRFGPRPGPFFRAARLAPAFGEPEVACTVDRTESVTPLGWHKTVTRRTCYRR